MTECYAFAIGGMPNPLAHPLRAKKTAEWLAKNMDGLIGVHLYDRYHTFLIFGTLNEAKIARNRIVAEGNDAGTHIMRAELSEDKQTLNVKEPAD